MHISKYLRIVQSPGRTIGIYLFVKDLLVLINYDDILTHPHCRYTQMYRGIIWDLTQNILKNLDKFQALSLSNYNIIHTFTVENTTQHLK